MFNFTTIISAFFLIDLFACLSVYIFLAKLTIIGLWYLVVYITAISILFIVARIILAYKEYISDPIIVLGLSRNLKTSAFYTGKGKGKAINPPSPVKSESSAESETDSELDSQIRKAKMVSLQKNNSPQQEDLPQAGPSRTRDSHNSPGEWDLFSKLTQYTNDWKTCNEKFLKISRLFNDLKIKQERQSLTEKEEKLLSEYNTECNRLKSIRNDMEEKLLKHGIDPSEQYVQKPSSDGGSSYSFYSSTSSKSSNYSESRSKKRVRYSDADNTTDFSLGFFLLNLAPVLRLVLSLFSAILLLVLDFSILPRIELFSIYIELSQLFFLYLIVNNIKLMHRAYSNIITLYNHYLNKDYMVIYFNLYYSIVTILLYLTSNSDIYILYF